MKNIKFFLCKLLSVMLITVIVTSCNNRKAEKSVQETNISVADTSLSKDTTTVKSEKITDSIKTTEKENINKNKVIKKTAKVEVHYFHVTNRCPSCIAIETATKKTLENYFKNEMKNATIKFYVFNVDDDANKAISEEYQAFGSSLFVTKITDGKKIKFDLTGEGFKYARNKEDKFIEILKEKITEALK